MDFNDINIAHVLYQQGQPTAPCV